MQISNVIAEWLSSGKPTAHIGPTVQGLYKIYSSVCLCLVQIIIIIIIIGR